jgi:predicted NAD/FAD-binding protein
MKIAVIGGGISGLAAAYMLAEQHDVTVYEAQSYAGGHSRTITVERPSGPVLVDTGFIVFNKRNYPLLTALFEHLKVPIAPSDMSFGVSIDNGWLEYGSRQLASLFAQPSNLIRPAFWRMLKDITVFNRSAQQYLNAPADLALGDCLDEMPIGDWAKHYYVLAMGACIWSMPLTQMLSFPAHTFFRFFANHGLLTINDHPQWFTVNGGSQAYVNKLTASFAANIRLRCGGARVLRTPTYVRVTDTQGNVAQYDHVIFACHADQALAQIAQPTVQEQSVLGAFKYQDNRVVLHRDIRLMPKHRGAWSSWVYRADQRQDASPSVSLSYWMNNLQPLPTTEPIIVTLNPAHEPAASLVEDETVLSHPVFNGEAIAAQARLDEVQGVDRLWYCGAYQRYGFHEDGLLSAVNVAMQLGARPPWLPNAWQSRVDQSRGASAFDAVANA